jgi:hypothetical protein
MQSSNLCRASSSLRVAPRPATRYAPAAALTLAAPCPSPFAARAFQKDLLASGPVTAQELLDADDMLIATRADPSPSVVGAFNARVAGPWLRSAGFATPGDLAVDAATGYVWPDFVAGAARPARSLRDAAAATTSSFSLACDAEAGEFKAEMFRQKRVSLTCMLCLLACLLGLLVCARACLTGGRLHGGPACLVKRMHAAS